MTGLRAAPKFALRVCHCCGVSFRPAGPNSKYCDELCFKRAQAVLKRERYAEKGEEIRAYGRQWRNANPGYNAEWRRQDRAKNPAKWLDLEHRRKALKRSVYVEEVNRRKVFERDGWLCGICGEPVDRGAKAPHPRSVSLDHIVPLAKGGEHSYVNTQCAHFWCNSVKSDYLEEAS